MKLVNNKDIKSKNGLVISAGSMCELRFDDTITICFVSAIDGDVEFRIPCSSLPSYFSELNSYPSPKSLRNSDIIIV